MPQEYIIEQGNWINDYPVELTVISNEEAYTQDFDMEIAWDDEWEEGFDRVGTGYLEGERFANIYKDGRWYIAQSKDQLGTTRESDEDPFIAFAQLVYVLGSW